MSRFFRRTGPKLTLLAAVVLMAVAGCVPTDGLDDLFRTVVSPRTWFVATTGDDHNDCLALETPCRTIGLAIERATAGDMIFVEPGTYQEFNTHGDGAFVIDKNINLLGDGPDADAVRLDGGGERPVLVIAGRAHPIVENLTIQNGGGGDGRGVLVQENAGLTMYRTVVRDNTGAGVFFTGGAGATLWLDEAEVTRNGDGGLRLGPSSTTIEGSRIIANTGPGIVTGGGFLTIRGTTIDGNQFDSNGEGLWVGEGSSVRVDSSTFSGHDHVAIFNDGVLRLENSTVSGNRVGIRNERDLSLVHSPVAYTLALSLDDRYATRVSIRNSIVLKAGATDCLPGSGTEIILEGDNLACWSTADGDLLLGPLADNGGPTQTLALLEGSPAIDAAGADCGVATDQRGEDRPQIVACDIGAFELRADELGAEPLSLPIEPTTPTGNPGLTTLEELNCRKGPGTAYEVVTRLPVGMDVPIDGRNGDSTWWYIRIPTSGQRCWVWGNLVRTRGNTMDLPIGEATALGCWVQDNPQYPKHCVVPCPANASPGGTCTP